MKDLMSLDIRSINSVWLTCDKSSSRWNSFEQMISNLGIISKMLNGKITTPYTIGVAMNHLEALSIDGKILVFEDDAQPTDHYNPIIEFPADADAVYLGTSTFGRVNKNFSHDQGAIAAKINDKILRLFNMLSLHAVLYITESYKNHVKDLLNKFIINPSGGVDDSIAESMYDYKVYGLQYPIFYQNDGHSNKVTLTPIKSII